MIRASSAAIRRRRQSVPPAACKLFLANSKNNDVQSRARGIVRKNQPSLYLNVQCRYFSKDEESGRYADSSFQLFDSLSGSLQNLPSNQQSKHATPSQTKKALAWYTCGPTTYAPAHMGHARTYVCLDIMRRVLEAQTNKTTLGRPLFVMNITNVDDKILTAAKEQNRSPLELAKHFEDEFWNDLESLNCLRPHVVTRVTDYVESDIIPFIETLKAKGFAYETDNGVYFDVRSYDEQLGKVTKYGKLAPSSNAQDITITSSASTEEESSSAPTIKKDPRDFVLWKPRKDGEDLWWPSPFGDGRPGWHIECSAMIEAVQKQFQETHQFLVHAGGIDLKFPHHTNEIAQSEAYLLSAEWIPHWVHTGHLHIDGLKMSKSLKNFITIREFLEEFGSSSTMESPADDFRLWCLGLSGSYRGPATFSRERIYESRAIRQKIVRFLMDGEVWLRSRHNAGGRWSSSDYNLFAQVRAAQGLCLQSLQNDMDGSTFLKQVMSIVESASHYMKENAETSGQSEPLREAVSIVREQLKLVGFSERTCQVGIESDHMFGESSRIVGGESVLVEELVNLRSAIRDIALKDVRNNTATDGTKEILHICDEARDKTLPAIGVEVLDGKSGDETARWRFCIPRVRSNDETKATAATSSVDKEPTRIEEFFKVGKYKNMFSEYTDDGIPMLNADGSEVSKRLLKKLLKKRDSFAKRKGIE
jgi:cysteinyl-tRNA synthetase